MTAIKPGSPEWLKIITPSKVPSILGISRWKSQRELWLEMAGIIEPAPITEAKQDDFDYGHAVELAAREYWLYKANRGLPDGTGWRLSRGEVQMLNTALPFDNLATVDLRASIGSKRRCVEVKKSRSLEEWGDDGSGVVPQDYAAQVMTQMLITGWHEQADLVLWPQFGMPRIYVVEWDQDVADWIVERCVAWSASLAANEPPPLDDSVSCYEAIRRLHPDIDGSEVEVPPALARQVLDWHRELGQTEKTARSRKTELLELMGEAKTAVCDGIKIAGRQPGRGGSVSLVIAQKNYDALFERHPYPELSTTTEEIA
ncbi:YqaJ viral recombinase family protein [Mycolicibacterium llatzerense]|uniref:YqaJ viral recombinase domain-containing protein n=1 Tax=Mycolicibacterium llatzerense TaxID=280871 RepID=A0A0D1J8F8_9MYCO|nr:YqaJ viral recombinase family protein [Mycolicibacterium llatzerense]KIU17883.1 hypothetical protein TL10_06395 [Mycolicibacterium llatzerense]